MCYKQSQVPPPLILMRDYTCTVFPMGWHNNWLHCWVRAWRSLANLKLLLPMRRLQLLRGLSLSWQPRELCRWFSRIVWTRCVRGADHGRWFWSSWCSSAWPIPTYMYGFGLIGRAYPQCGMVSHGYDSFIKNVWTKTDTFIRSAFFPLSARSPLATAS